MVQFYTKYLLKCDSDLTIRKRQKHHRKML
jgi:hypothetical protein